MDYLGGVGLCRVGLGVGCALLLSAAPARAAELRWQAPAECAPDDNVRAQIEQLVRKPLAEIDGIDFEVEIRGDGQHWSVRVRRLEQGPEGEPQRERTIEGTT